VYGPRRSLARVVDAALEGAVPLSFSRVGIRLRSRLPGWPELPAGVGVGRQVVVTGANSGLGYATARSFLAAGAEVLVTVRSVEKGEQTLRRLTQDLGRDLSDHAAYDVLDLASLASVRAFAARRLADERPADTVVHNAGAMFDERADTVDGLERTYQTHVVAPFLLTALLLPRLAEVASPRVVTVTSGGMYTQRLDTALVDTPDRYRGSVAYARAKRAQVALTQEWARRVGHLGIGFQVVHPGWALTPGVEASLPRFRRVTGPVLRSPDEGADTVVFVALADGLPVGAHLWHDRRPRREHKVPWTRTDPHEAERLWQRVCQDAGIDPASEVSALRGSQRPGGGA
jgi:dehydrogenase/reductase SDR family member 12